MTADEVRPGRDMTDDAVKEMIFDVFKDARDAITEWGSADDSSDTLDTPFFFLQRFVENQRGADGSRDAAAWGDFLDWLGALDLADPVDRRHAAHAFDGYVRQVADSDRSEGGYVTPDPPVNLMLDLAAPAPGERVYDPCFGYGGLLAGAVRRMQAANGAAAGQRVPLAAVTGVERSQRAYLVGLCRVVLAGATSHRLVYADALEKPVPDDPDAGFDCILAVPPVDSWQADDFDDEDDVSPFLRHVMAQLRPGGRAVVALPERPLFHDDSLPMRKKILSDYHVQRVVALPAGAFEPHTAIPMSIVVFSRDEPGESVRFATVSPMAWEAAQEDAMAISESIGDRPASAGSVSTGVESWSVPVSELALRSYELLAKPPDNALDAAIKRLLAADPELKVERLDDVADIMHFNENLSEDEVRESQPNRDVGAILRATDLTGAGLRLPTENYHVSSDELGGFLRDADLLVPLEDTIGNVELIPSGGDWNLVIVDDTIAVVCAGEGISPQFLAAMLRSPAYSFWFWSHAEGSTIRRLSVDALRTLRIPAPPAAVQDAVLQELSEQRGDALAVLHRLLSGAKKNPVADWLEKPLPARVVAAAGAADGLDAGDLSELASGILAIADTDYGSSGAWLRSARRAARTLKGYDTVPSVSGRLVILEHALVRFHEALHEIGRSEEELFDRLRSCTRGMMRLAEQKVVALQEAAKLDFDVTPPEVEAGVPCEVRLRMTNGSVPLRDLQVTARQPDGTATTAEAAYLAEGVTHEIPVAVRAPDSAESHRIDVAWQARHLDAAPHRDEAAVYVLVGPSQSVAQGDLGDNPYIVGNPIDRDEMFFGREGIMDKIRRNLGGDSANVILLEGNRRTGKTSILKRLEQKDELPDWIPVYCSFQDVDSVATANVFRLLARQTGLTLADAGIETWIPDLPAPDSGRPFKLEFLAAVRSAFSGGHPYEMLSLYLAAAIDAAKPRRVLLMLDEFDKLQEGIDRGITSPQVPENIRHLLQHQPGLGAIITGSRRLKRLREEYWSALFGFGLRIGVSALPEDEARRLVTEPVARRIRYLPQARDRLVALCARHPFLIQSLCSKVFERAATGSERTITGDAVEHASTEMVRDNEHFQTLWGYAGSERRRLILALCDRMSDLPDAVNLDLLAMKFEEYGVPVRDDHLDDDIAELRELELLEIDESYRGGTYRLSIPLMAEWLRMNVVFDDLVKRARKEANRHAE